VSLVLFVFLSLPQYLWSKVVVIGSAVRKIICKLYILKTSSKKNAIFAV